MLCRFISMLMIGTLTACSTYVPKFDLSYKDEYQLASDVNKVAAHIHCDLENALIRLYGRSDAAYLADWSAKVTLTLTVDEKSSVSPGLALTQILPNGVAKFASGNVTSGQSLGVAIGANYNTDSTRILILTWFLVFKDFLLDHKGIRKCGSRQADGLSGDLKIFEGLNAAILAANAPDTIPNHFQSGGPLQTVEYHLTFMLEYIGNLTPSFKLINVSGNPSGNFLSGDRMRKDDLLITMGPTQLSSSGRKTIALPSTAVENQHLASQIGQAVATAIQK